MIRVIPVAAAMLLGIAPLAQAATCSEQMAEVSTMVELREERDEKSSSHAGDGSSKSCASESR